LRSIQAALNDEIDEESTKEAESQHGPWGPPKMMTGYHGRHPLFQYGSEWDFC